MKRSVCILLALCLILPCIALSEGWTCPSCGKQWTDTERFCGGCGSARPEEAHPVIRLVEVGRDYAQISWSGFAGATEYRIYVGDAAQDDWSRVDKVTACRYEFTDLAPGTAFDVRIKGDNGLEMVYSGITTRSAPAPTPAPESVQTAAQTNRTDSYIYEVLDDGTVMITGYTGSDSDIVVPGELDGRAVSAIGTYTFTEDSNDYGNRVLGRGVPVAVPHRLTSVTIPAGVTSIGDWAFYSCTGLKSIILPTSVTSLGECAFRNCTGLTTITLPGSVTGISNGAFYGCSGLMDITISDGVTSIGDAAFSGCSSLTDITLPDSVTSIGRSAFTRCSSLASITIPAGVTSIEPNAFIQCKKLTSVTLPDGVTSIGYSAFYQCISLTAIAIPDSVTDIGKQAFGACAGLASVTVTPGSYAEQWCRDNGFTQQIIYP